MNQPLPRNNPFIKTFRIIYSVNNLGGEINIGNVNIDAFGSEWAKIQFMNTADRYTKIIRIEEL